MLSVGAAKLVRWIVLALLALPVAFAAVPPPPAPPTPDVDAVAGPVLLTPPETIWTSMNMGAGSGLDADLLDGLDSAYFLDAIAAESASRAADVQAERAAREAADAALAARMPKVHYVPNTQGGTAVCDGTARSLGNAAITVTTSGPAMLDASGTSILRLASGYTRVFVGIDGPDSFSPAFTSQTGAFATVATQRVMSVPAGTHTVSLGYQCGAGSAFVYDNSGTLVVRVFPQ